MSDVDTTADKTGFVANEPVVVAHLVLWVLANLGAFVVQHSHNLISATQWADFSTGWTPYITAAILAGSAWFLRKYVTPYWKKLTGTLQKDGIPVPTNDQLDTLAEAIYEKLFVKQANAQALAAEPYLNAKPANAGNVE